MILASALALLMAGTSPIEVSLCDVMERPESVRGKLVAVRGSVQPMMMHGAYILGEPSGCSLLMVLPQEIPRYGGQVRLNRDTEFERFEKARWDVRGAVYSAVFVGEVEVAPSRKRFGYYRNQRARLVLQSVQALPATVP